MSATAPARVLVVEDTPTQAELARLLLEKLGHDVRIETAAAPALAAARSWRPDAVLMDIELPDYSGLELMKRLAAEGIDAAIIVLTANASINLAIDAMRAGAVDFIAKPYASARLSVTLANALEKRALERESTRLKQANDVLTSRLETLDRRRFHGFIGACAGMQVVYRTIESVAASRASVFITGESGTGKELAAEAVHKASPRAGRPFVALNCGAIPRDLLESEVFGHIKGAFTGATADRPGAAKLADSGTLFLDEIAEMPLEMQVKLLRFVQTGTFSAVGSGKVEKVDVRFVCATNRDPLLEVQAGRFREDLYYRLYVVPVELPPLRERGEDVLLIARHFLSAYTSEEHRRFRGFSPEAERRLLAYAWPGNVRQLQNVVRNIVVLHDAERVEAEMLPALLHRAALAPVAAPLVAAPPVTEPPVAAPAAPEPLVYADPAPPPVCAAAEPPPLPPAPEEDVVLPLAVMERRLITAALRRTGNDVPRAAALLEVNPSTIYRKLQAWRSEGSAA